jgi:subtilisin family serine protease
MRQILSSPLTLLLLLVAAFGCSGGSSSASSSGNSNRLLAGTIAVSGSPNTVAETEPNDSFQEAQQLGQLGPGETITVLGDTSSAQNVDPFDSFRLDLPQRVQLEMTLSFDAGQSNDFDLYVYSPVGSQFVEAFTTPSVPETGEVHAKGSCFLVLNAFSGEGPYTLTLRASAPTTPIDEREQNTAHGQGQFLGELTTGDELAITGTVQQGADGADLFVFACPEPIQVALQLEFAPGDDLDLAFYDATTSITNPVQIALFDTTNNPETGQVGVPAMQLITIEVRANGSTTGGAYLLRLAGVNQAQGAGGGSPGLGSFGARGLASPELAARRMRHRAGDEPFGMIKGEAFVGEVIVKVADPSGADALFERRGCSELQRAPGGTRLLRFELPPNLSDAERLRYTYAFAASLSARSEVLYAEPNGRVKPMGEPNDQFYGHQWHYPLIDLPQAWDITTGDANVIVAVLDTGMTQHPDLIANQIGGYDMISDPTSAADGDGPDPDPTDVGDGNASKPDSFHGTHVAGTIGAQSNNGLGVAGVAWNVSLMHVRVLGKQGGSNWDVANGVRYAAGLPNSANALPPQPARILNMSLGGIGFSQVQQDAITAARNAGCIVFVAAGNDNNDLFNSPAGLDGVISVSAVNMHKQKGWYSNFHPTVKLAAPGGAAWDSNGDTVDTNADGLPDGVLSTLVDSSGPTDQFIYSSGYHGTSMACPHAAGVAALILSVNPGLNSDQVEAIMTSTASDLGNPGRDDIYGFGLVNAFAAVQAAQSGGGGGPVLGLGSSSISLAAAETTRDVSVQNLGTGLLEVTQLSWGTASGGDWLSASPIFGDGVTSNLSAIRVAVDRGNLADGNYAGQVTVDSNGGSKTLQVVMLVGDQGQGDDVDIYILAVDPQTLETLAVRTVNPTQSLDYAFANLPIGEYLLVGGSDDDGDGVLFGAGDRFRGGYPTFDAMEVVKLGGGQKLRNLDFAMLESSTSQGGGEEQVTFRIDI